MWNGLAYVILNALHQKWIIYSWHREAYFVRCSLTWATKSQRAKDRATKVSSISCVTFWFGISRILFISSFRIVFSSFFFLSVDASMPESISNCARNMMQWYSNRKKCYKIANKKKKKLHVDCMTFATTYTTAITLNPMLLSIICNEFNLCRLPV